MRNDATFGRLGESRKFRFADASCIGNSCFEPLVLIEKRTAGGDREHCGCRSLMTSECSGLFQRNYRPAVATQRLRDGWVHRP